MVVGLRALNERKTRQEVYQLLDEFKARPELQRLIQGGETVEYSSHLIPEGGLRIKPRLYTDGMVVVGDAAGFGLNMLITVRGMEYAMISGVLAAETIKRAKEKKEFSAATLSHYETLLNQSVVLKDLETFRRSIEVLENPRLFSLYPQSISDLFEKLMWIDRNPKERLSSIAWKELRKEFLTVRGMRDLWSLRKI
jgi:electron transfer flavoprotein-quinone oxidoreductase